jgi:hypothetical protein
MIKAASSTHRLRTKIRISYESESTDVIGPHESWLELIGMTPLQLVRPMVGRKPTRLFAELGTMMLKLR